MLKMKKYSKTKPNSESVSEIKLGVIISYLTIIFNILSGLIYTPWMVRQIGHSDYGLYTLSASFISMFAVDFGLGSAVSRFISKYRAQGEQKKISEFLGITYKIYLVIAISIFTVLCIMFFYIDNIYIQLTPSEIEKFKVIYCISGLFTVISFPFMTLNGIIISHEKFIFQKSLDLLHKILIIVLMAISLLYGYGLYSLVLVNAFVGILLIIIKLMYIKKYIPQKVDFGCKNKKIVKQIFSFSIWTTIILIMQRFILNITPSILAITSGTEEIAIFSVAMTIEGYTFTFSTALSGLFLPKVTQMVYKDNTESLNDIEDLMIKVGRIQLIIIGAIVTIFITQGNEFITLWMGKSFKDSYIVSILLILNSVIIVTQEIANTMLIAVNKIKYEALSVSITAIISILLSFTLSKYGGAIGSATAIFIGNFVGRVVVRNIVYKKVLGLNIKRFFKECHLKMSIPLILTLVIGFVLSQFIVANNLFIFACKVVILGLFYILLMWLFSFNESEKKSLLQPCNLIINKLQK
ncbi:oligosaccharide flippase family protein [Romboutsia timonensis]|uniref:oligosaccharide flippase family protein n=1 Tax=Romboutsia timonensis TaxID=1776391 RepID=UPI0009F2F33D|nr:oligosaccharide flippase family protein [Romboutsia timonensis]